MLKYKNRALKSLALLVLASSLAGCVCGPFGFHRCHGGYGGGHDGYGGGYGGNHGYYNHP